MPRYFFNVHDGQSEYDEEGVELPDLDHARREAIRLSGNIFDSEAKKIALGDEWRMEVTDEKGMILFRFDFVTTVSSAVTASTKPF